MNEFDIEHWKIFWQQSRKKSFRALFVMTPLIVLIVFAFNYTNSKSDDDLWISFRTAALYSYSISLMISLVSTLMWVFITFRGQKLIMAMRGVLWPHFFTTFTGLLLGLKLANAIEVLYLNGEAILPEQFNRDIVFGSLISLAMIFMFAYFETKKAAKQLGRANEEANFQALKAQMHPHFLFNSLNSLSALIESDPLKAEKMTQQLADLYRTILSASQKSTISLREELEVARAYLEIETTRFSDRLKFNIDVEDTALSREVPALMLQTLVENAIKHGISGSIAGGEVLVSARTVGNKIELAVLNTGAPLKKDFKDGTGLKNTRDRLRLMFGDQYVFTIATTPTGKTESKIVF